MQLDRPLCFLDLEGTDKDPAKSYIVEIGITVVAPSGERKRWEQRFKPPVPIPAEATEIHHISDDDVKDCPTFDEWATRIRSALQGKDLAGYNLWRYDLPLLDEELRRAGQRLDLEGVRVIDVYGIYAKKRPRTLSDCIREFCGREHEGAHGAAADAEGTADALAGQLAAFEDLAAMSLDELAEFSRQSEHRVADIAGKLYYDPHGELCYAFGKWKDCRVIDQPGYANWMLRCWDPPFPASTCELLRQALGLVEVATDDPPNPLVDALPDRPEVDETPGGSPIFEAPYKGGKL